MAGAKWLKTAASTVERWGPIRYFLSPGRREGGREHKTGKNTKNGSLVFTRPLRVNSATRHEGAGGGFIGHVVYSR